MHHFMFHYLYLKYLFYNFIQIFCFYLGFILQTAAVAAHCVLVLFLLSKNLIEREP